MRARSDGWRRPFWKIAVKLEGFSLNITVIGPGRWGSFIAWYLQRCGHQVLLYGTRGSAKYEQFVKTRENGLLELPPEMELGCDLAAAVERAEILIISVGAQNYRGLLEELKGQRIDGKKLVLCMKGVEQGTGLRLTEVTQEVLEDRVRVAIWVGPGHVQDFVRGIPNCMVIDSADEALKKELVEKFSSDLIRFYYGGDLLGNEIGAASKNVIGIAAGMLDGMGKTSLKGALMSRGTREIARLICAMGGKEMTAYGLSHLGDYEATVFSPHSHNRMYGETFIKKGHYGELAEGVATASAMVLLSDRYGVELPICRTVHLVLSGEMEPERALSGLFLRSLKDEMI